MKHLQSVDWNYQQFETVKCVFVQVQLDPKSRHKMLNLFCLL